MRKRNKFSLSHYKLLTGKMGYLYPISCVETLPGDTFQMATSVFLRFSPMVAPVMTPVVVKIHHWFVPLRLIWEDFEDFITGGPDGSSAPVPPFIAPAAGDIIPSGSLHDYLGIPVGTYNGSLRISTLPIRAYRLIWNEWYRDQSLQDEIVVRTASGQDSNANMPGYTQLLRDAWAKDYFTTASPSEQRGVAVSVPVQGYANPQIVSDGQMIFGYGDTQTDAQPVGSLGVYPTSNDDVARLWRTEQDTNPPSFRPASYVSGLKLEGQGTPGAINLNQWREAMALQRFEEHRQIYGSRYVEYLRYLGVKASDARLQRPEYLGGGRSVIQFSEVLQTAEGTDPVGTMRGHGIGAMRTNRFRRFFEEHGFVISLLSIRPKSVYTQGLNRMFSRQIKTDYWQRELQHIGQQQILNSEIYGLGTDPNGVFGYTDRYDEYRSHPSQVVGEFRELLNFWHLGREFSEQPVLNSDFISSLPSDRIFADQTGTDTIYMMVNNSIQARRPISKRGNAI